MDADSQRELARLLAQLRRDGRQQSGLDTRLVPPDKATAYRIAGMVAAELDWPVLGWKIAAAKEEMQKALRTDSPIYGRTFFLRETPASFVHARLAILSGRPEAVRRQLSEALLAVLEAQVPRPDFMGLQLCVEVQEIHRETYAKATVTSLPAV